MTYTPDTLPSDMEEWLKQVARKKQALDTAICSMPWAPKHVSDVLNRIEHDCKQAAFAKVMKKP